MRSSNLKSSIANRDNKRSSGTRYGEIFERWSSERMTPSRFMMFVVSDKAAVEVIIGYFLTLRSTIDALAPSSIELSSTTMNSSGWRTGESTLMMVCLILLHFPKFTLGPKTHNNRILSVAFLT